MSEQTGPTNIIWGRWSKSIYEVIWYDELSLRMMWKFSIKDYVVGV